MTHQIRNIRIDPQHCGPPGSANGGYSAGVIAAAIEGPCEVTLRAPPPLGTDLRLESDGQAASLHDGDILIATAAAAALDLTPPPDPGFEQARAVRDRYAGFVDHNFPRCFVCGPQRDEHDGLRVFAAPLGDQVVAAWRPPAGMDGSVDPVLIHAVLDCPSYFALRDTSLLALLGRMHGEVFDQPTPDEPCVVVAWPIRQDRRKHISGAALYGADGRLIAMARNTWIELAGDTAHGKQPA